MGILQNYKDIRSHKISRDYGGGKMLFAYVIENKKESEVRSNEELFKIIQKEEIQEENIYFDTENSLDILIDNIQEGDTLYINRFEDLMIKELKFNDLLRELEEKEVQIIALEQEVLSGNHYYSAIHEAHKIIINFQEQKRQAGYKKACQKGKVGRPQKKEGIEKAIRLYHTNKFTIKEIEEMSDVSKTTLFRHLKASK